MGEGLVRGVAGKGSQRSGVGAWVPQVKLGLDVLRMGRRARRKQSPGEGTQGTTDSEIWETVGFNTVQHTLYRALEIRPLVLKATPYEVCAGLIPISHLVKLRHRYITCLGFPISKWQGQDLNLGTLRIWDLTHCIVLPFFMSMPLSYFGANGRLSKSLLPSSLFYHTPHRPGHPGSLSSASLSLLFRIII